MRKILVADDEKVVRDVISRFLRLKDYDVFTVENGREAVKRVTDDNFDLLIMDLRMPGLRAQEILQAIRETKKDLPVIILTGTIDAEESEVLQKFGHPVEDIISKPADLFEILEKIKEKLPNN
jgi:CheY-like chemotaxis protein